MGGGRNSDVREPSDHSVPTKVSGANTSIEAELDDSMDEGRWQQAVRRRKPRFGDAREAHPSCAHPDSVGLCGAKSAFLHPPVPLAP